MYTILCVDDHMEDLYDAIAVLQKEMDAVHILTATSYSTAIKLLNNNKIDVFIIDIELSDGRHTGIQLADTIKMMTEYHTTPIIFVSMYSHYSRRLLSVVQNCAFLTKPVKSDELLYMVGNCLGISRYIKQNQKDEPFIIPTSQNQFVEINPKDVSYIELNHNELIIQYINGQTVVVKCMHGCFKLILKHINTHSISYLKQIYRSIIVNIDQIKEIDLKGNVGTLRLFGDMVPKPIGSKYKDQLSELL